MTWGGIMRTMVLSVSVREILHPSVPGFSQIHWPDKDISCLSSWSCSRLNWYNVCQEGCVNRNQSHRERVSVLALALCPSALSLTPSLHQMRLDLGHWVTEATTEGSLSGYCQDPSLLGITAPGAWALTAPPWPISVLNLFQPFNRDNEQQEIHQSLSAL